MSNETLSADDPTKGPWGTQDGDNNTPHNPWKRRPGDASSHSNQQRFEEKIVDFQNRLKKKIPSGPGGGGISKFSIALVVGILFLLWLSSGFFRVQEGELAAVLRFGEAVRVASPGLRYHIPAPIEMAMIQKVSAVNTITTGNSMADRHGHDTSDQTIVLTGDENMVYINYTVLWKINDINNFLFIARRPVETIRVAAESVMREIIGQTTARAALTEGRDLVGSQAQALLQRLMDEYKIGVQIVGVQLQKVAPPQEVVDSFYDVQASLVDAERLQNEAEAYKNDIIPRARGQAMQVVQDSEAFREAQVAHAQGEAKRFELLYESYLTNKDVTMKKLYLETMQKILKSKHKLILDAHIGNNILPHLPIQNMGKNSNFASAPMLSTQKGGER